MFMITINAILASLTLFILPPQTLLLLTLIFTVSTSLAVSLVLYSSLFSFILFMVFIGGLLVLFMYACALSMNSLVNKIQFIKLVPTILIILFLSLLYISPPVMSKKPNLILNTLPYQPMEVMFSVTSFTFYVFLILYLFLALLLMVMMISESDAPLRRSV